MEQITLGNTAYRSSRLVYGCMRLAGDGSAKAKQRAFHALEAAVTAGFNHFDHADIYAHGLCETWFGEYLAAHPSLRDKLILTSKCGIRFQGDPTEDAPGRYDSSAPHIRTSVEGILKRLRIDQLDVLLLHRPDYLMDPVEVADSLSALRAEAKIAQVGLSNCAPSAFACLQQALPFPLILHQVEFNLHRLAPLYDGVLDQCLSHRITPQSWCPLGGVAYPAWNSTISDEAAQHVSTEVERQARHYACEPTDIALAWILRHPARITPLIGSTNPTRIAHAPHALTIPYTREDWYRLLIARNGPLP